MEMAQIRKSTGLLYPMMIIAAIAVIVFSIIGIASITGWMPHAMLGNAAAAELEPSVAVLQRTDTDAEAPAFQCAECGVIESIREIERRGTLSATPVAAADEQAPATTGL